MEKERGKSRQANGIKLIEGKRERDFGLEEGRNLPARIWEQATPSPFFLCPVIIFYSTPSFSDEH